MWVFRKLDEGADWVAGKVKKHPALTGALAAGGIAVAVVGTGGLALVPVAVAVGTGAAVGKAVASDPGMEDKKPEEKK